ncbi:leucine--tRNA ligase [Flavobacterium arcticum]|uniref:Leucine--tRNA ligase n=1 Tax=Flavobacterium arcticum TaxID=1784713 RepID=A0A345HA59_9FLAO|nr:class I tRNA ligase family protein [Flavobacterium arcticum]AXG73469.1 leucine--tRNA ligase [Flavobacterium arcticum]KAF2513258.1 leucine--tRNA ligase [Flavobacterium arcticum]
MRYNPNEIEAKWQKYWAENKTFKAEDSTEKPKYYVLDMFPYPSGAGLHVGHPLGYIASDIYARYKRHQGFNVLHPQGYDSFGLPAEQYAIQTGQHPAVTTATNIARYREQLDKIGFSFDWDREVRTSNPEYYKWTQWIFIQLFNSWYNNDTDKAESICTLIAKFEANGNTDINAVCDDNIATFTADAWKSYSKEQQEKILLQYRLTYLAETEVNWCPALGTVLANDEIVNGVSERGGHPVMRKKMTQWSMRISAYAERLLQGLNTIDWTESLKESQRNWIGKSVGASVTFNVKEHDAKIEVFTTRPDTIFGVSFMTLAPEHDLVAEITTPEQAAAVTQYIEATAKRSERDRMADVKTISGVFTGAYAEHPFTKEPVQIWIGDYVLAGYGTGAVMAVPCGDQRDYDFAKHFNIEIKNIFAGIDISEEAYASKENVVLQNSDFLDGLDYKTATKKAITALEEISQGMGKTNYRLRDAVFSRQRYWGEPFPVYYVNGMPQMIDKEHLPIRLPEVEKYLPTEDGQPPLGNATTWAWSTTENKVVSNDHIDNETIFPLELNTMPGWAGSSWYWLRYMDAGNENEFVSEANQSYWQNVDLYIGGSEHATGHLLYSRFWNKFLQDRGFVQQEEPFKKLINQGMILGESAFTFRINGGFYYGYAENISQEDYQSKDEIFDNIFDNIFDRRLVSWDILKDKNYEAVVNGLKYKLTEVFSEDLKEYFEPSGFDINKIYFTVTKLHVPVEYVNLKNEIENEEGLASWYNEDIHTSTIFRTNGKFTTLREVEKMSKSKYNVVNPDDICEQYGADTLRLYEMFLGPLEQAKPWNTAGITGVSGFLKKLWKLYFDDNGLIVTDNEPSKEAYKILHRTIKKVQDDIENFSFNTSVSSFMIAVNELTAIKCHERAILEPLAILMSPYAPHIAEELWSQLGNEGSIARVAFPEFNASHLVESSKEYPVSFNGKMRFKIELPMDMPKDEIEKTILADERTIQQLNGQQPKKVIVVPGKIINIVG